MTSVADTKILPSPLPPINSRVPDSRPKSFLKEVLRYFGFDLVRYQPTPVRPINILDLAVRATSADNSDFFFVQIGANDGIRHDPLRELVQELGLKGLLVEPLPDIFEDLKHNYASEPQLMFKNAAVSSGEETIELARFRSDVPGDDSLHSLASAEVDRIRQLAYAHGLEDYVEHVEVPCVTFETLIDEFDVDRVDMLVIDVEGHEWELLQAAFDTGLRPKIIFIEFLHLSFADRLDAEAALTKHGYAIAYSGIDLVALH